MRWWLWGDGYHMSLDLVLRKCMLYWIHGELMHQLASTADQTHLRIEYAYHAERMGNKGLSVSSYEVNKHSVLKTFWMYVEIPPSKPAVKPQHSQSIKPCLSTVIRYAQTPLSFPPCSLPLQHPHLTVSHPFKVIFLNQSLPSPAFQSVFCHASPGF